MRTVNSPRDGYEVSVSFCDGARAWRVFAKPVGATFATNCGIVGDAHAPEPEIDAQAAALAARWIDHGMVR